MLMLDDLLMLPVSGLFGVFEAIHEQVNLIENESFDIGALQKKLSDLQLKLEFAEISEEDYFKQESEILQLLDNARINLSKDE